MHLTSLRVCHVQIPFRMTFRHAAAERGFSDNVVVIAQLDDGSVGYGECVPREYVTDETVDSVLSSFEGKSRRFFKKFRGDSKVLVNLLRGLSFQSFSGNAALCAFELALLDALGHATGKPVFALLGCPKPPPWRRIRYSAVIGAEKPRTTLRSLLKVRAFGFKQVKIKVGLGEREDVQRLRRARLILGSGVDIRLDANGAWKKEDAIGIIRLLSRFNPSVIEQPLPTDQLSQMAELRKKTSTPIMLDESVCSDRDARAAIRAGACDMFNIRLSKCGGIIKSQAIFDFAANNGISCQLGCQVGESGILSAAGRAFAVMNPALKYLEGSYDRFLLAANTTAKDVSFGFAGRASPLHGHGLGVRVDPEAIRSITKRCIEIEW